MKHKLRIVWILTLLQILWPLSAVSVYAQAPTPAVIEAPAPEPTSTREEIIPPKDISPDLVKQPRTLYYPPAGDNSDASNLQRINTNSYNDYSPRPEDLSNQPEGDWPGRFVDSNFARVQGENGIFYQIDPGAAYEGDSGNETVVGPDGVVAPTSPEDTTTPSCSSENPDPLCSEFQIKIDELRGDLATIGAFEKRLAINGSTGRALLLGEKCDPTEPIKPVDDVIVNGQCDRAPRVDARLILLLDYLLRAKKDGGAGREYIELGAVARFTEDVRQEGATYIDGVSGKCVVDVKAPADDPRGISTCLQIKAIDKIRITTRIVKYGVFGKSAKYRYKAPIPIKVAWQSETGQQQVPLPAISTQELIGNYSVESLLELLEQEDFLSDPDFSGRPLQSMGLADITRFIGGRLLKQLMDGQNIANFNFGDTIEDFGVLALAGALNIDPLVLKGANSLEDIERAQGRSWVAEQIGLDRPLAGANPSEIFADVARQQIGKLLDIKPYVLESYQAGEFIQRLGQGAIEMRLPVPERSFSSNVADEVKAAVSPGRFALIFPSPGNANNDSQLAEIDERLDVPIGTSANFARTGDVAALKDTVGQAVWAEYFGRYSDNVAGGFVPEHPSVYLGRLITPANAQPVGDLTKIYEMTNPNSGGAAITHPVGMSEEDSAAVSTLEVRLNELHSQIGTIRDRVQSVINAAPLCANATYPAGRPVASCPTGIGGRQEVNLLDARRQALDRMPVAEFEEYLNSIMRLADRFMAEASWNGEYVVLPSTGSQYYLSVTASLRQISDALQRVHDHIATYREFGSNADGSSQRVDQLMNLPAGTANKLLSGGAEAQNALMGAGIRTVAEYLPTTNDRSRFEMLATSAAQGVAQTMVVTDSQKRFLAEVFLTTSPDNEFARIGRRILINNLSTSAQAETLTQTEFWSDINFYIDRYETITSALNTIRSETGSLESQLSALPASIQSQANQMKDAASSLFTLFNGIDPSSLTFSNAQNLVSTKREQFYSLQNTANSLSSSLSGETNRITGRIESSVNNILTAARALEQSVMEILEGRPVTAQSNVPNNLNIPDVNLASFQRGVSGRETVAQQCTARRRQLSVLTMLYGDLNTSFRGSEQSTTEITGDALKKIFITMGSTKLAEMLGLPMESFLYFSQADDKSPNNFFVSVGRGQLLSQCQNPDSKTTDELTELGRNYIIAHSLTALSGSLGVNLPSWVNADTIAKMITGRVDDVLLAVGSNQVENLLDLPSGTVTRLVRPEGATEVARREERERTVIDIVLSQLDVELDLPPGFSLTGDPILSMGLARLEGVLGFERGRIEVNSEDDTAQWALTNAINQITQEASREQRSGQIDSAIYANETEINTRVQLIAGLGMTLPLGLSDQLQALDTARQSLEQAAAGTDAGNTLYLHSLVSAKQRGILTTLQLDNEALFTSAHPFIGLENDPNVGPDEDARWQDAVNRQQSLERRLRFLDARFGVPGKAADGTPGTTEKWLIGQITTTDFARLLGGGAAEQLGTSAFISFLDRVGAEGPWADAIKSRQVDTRTGLNNLDLLKEVVLGRRPLNGSALAQVYQMMSQTMSFDFDRQAGFEAGTIASMIANPSRADEIAFDQGVRIFADKVLHFDITVAPDEGKTLKRLASAMIYGATYNSQTGLFEGVSFNGITLNGGQAVLAGLSEFTNITRDWVQDKIPNNEWRFFQVPMTTLFDGLSGQLRNMGAEGNYIQLAQAQSELRERVNSGTATPEERARIDTLGNYNAGLASIRQPDLPAATSTSNSIFDLESLDQFITQKRVTSPAGSHLTEDEQKALETLDRNNTPTFGFDGDTPEIDYNPPSSIEGVEASEAEKMAAEDALAMAGDEATSIRYAQAYWQNTMQQVVKAATYAAADYGLDKLFNLPRGVIKPGMAMTLFEGSVSQKVSVVVDIGINYLLKSVAIPADLQFLLNYDNIRQATAFFLNQEGRGQLLAQAFGDSGIFADIQSRVFPKGLFGEIPLPKGTFGAMVGYLYNGNVGNFQINGQTFKGLGNLFNTKWVMEIGFNYVGKLIGVDSAILVETFRLSYDFYQAFAAWNELSNMEIEEIANQISSVAGFKGDAIEAATNKLAAAQTQMITAAIALGIFAINLLFGKQINKFEQAIGLPPGTLLQGLSIILTAILIGTGPMFFVGLGIFLLTTILGFGYVKTTIRATADGYYPFTGELGVETKAGQKGIPHSQYPSADILDDNGAVIPSRALGQFDPTNATQKREGFMAAAQQKVKGVIMDSVNRTQLNKYFRGIGLISDDTTEADVEELMKLMRPNQIFVTNTPQDDNKLLYIDSLEIIRLNRSYYNATKKDDNSGYCNKNYPAGICAGEPGQFIDTLQLSY